DGRDGSSCNKEKITACRMLSRRRCRHDPKPFPSCSRWNRPRERPSEPKGGCRRPRAPRRQKDRFSALEAQNRQSRIVLLAPLQGERKPAIRSQACNARKLREAAVCSDISSGLSKVQPTCR